MVTPAPVDCRGAIDLLKGRLGCSAQIIASCTLDLSSMNEGKAAYLYIQSEPCSCMIFIPAEIHLDLKDDADNKFGELTICVASSLAFPNDAIESANWATQQLGPSLTRLNDTIQAITPLTTKITPAWQSLVSHLETLVKVADIVTKAYMVHHNSGSFLGYLTPH
jgi:hypothetical protein